MDSLVKKTLDYICLHGLINKGDCVVVAVSGGPDSVCLLHLLNNLTATLNMTLHIAHLDHGLRGADSQADANYVKELAECLGLPVTIVKADVHAWKAKRRTSLEEAAREVRYRFLAEVARKVDAAAVAVGHTTDDHVETVLLHLVRGTGLAGLQGLLPDTYLNFSPRIRLRIIRPLLNVTRSETSLYCQSYNLKPRIDASNTDRRYLRNRIRAELLPLLKQMNPEFVHTITRLSKAAHQAYSFLHDQALKVWAEVVRVDRKTIMLNKSRMLAEDPAVRGELIRMAIIKLLGESRDFTSRHFEVIGQMFSSPAGRTIDLPHQLRAISHHDSVVLQLNSEKAHRLPPPEKALHLQVPGITRMPGWQIEATISQEMPYVSNGPLTAVFDMDTTGNSLTVSARKAGDRFQPLGMSLPKKLQDFMVDNHIPREWRDSIPLVRSGSDIIWVVGYRIGHRFRVTAATKRFLTLRFRQTVRTGLFLPAGTTNAEHLT